MRNEDRQGHSTAFKVKTIRICVGEITFAVPPVREGGLYPIIVERQSHLPRQSMKVEVAAIIRAVFNAPDQKSAEEFLHAAIQIVY